MTNDAITDHDVALNDSHSMPRLGYGLWQIGDRQAESLVGSAIAAGFRQFDTVQAYDNEAGVGRAIRTASQRPSPDWTDEILDSLAASVSIHLTSRKARVI